MIMFKSCPKCQGDLYLAGDSYGKYWDCLQCGHLLYVAETQTQSSHQVNPVRHFSVTRELVKAA